MKIFILNFTALTFLLVTTSWIVPSEKPKEAQLPVEDCAAVAWNAGTVWCANRGGCTEYELWYFTNTAYEVCISEQPFG